MIIYKTSRIEFRIEKYKKDILFSIAEKEGKKVSQIIESQIDLFIKEYFESNYKEQN